jgi:hypothetical protein
MKAKTHNMVEEITLALGPIFYKNSDYDTIRDAMSLVIARVAQATPEKGYEEEELETIMTVAADALNEFIIEEKLAEEARQKILDKGISGFSGLYLEANEDSSNTGDSSVSRQKEAFEIEQERQDNPDGPRAYTQS